MKKILFTTILATLSLGAYAENGYMGFGLGIATNDACDQQPVNTECEDTKAVGRIIGGYQFNDNFAIEGAYASLGEAEIRALSGPGKIEIDGSAFSLSLVGIAPISDSWSLYGKAGIGRWTVDASVVDASGNSFSGDDDGTDPLFGVGLMWTIERGYNLRFEFERQTVGLKDASDGFFDDVDVDTISLTYAFNF